MHIGLQNAIVGQSHLSNNQRGHDWISEQTKWLCWHWPPWQPWGTTTHTCPHGCTHRTEPATPDQATADGQDRTSPCSQTYPSHLWGAQPDFSGREKAMATSKPNVLPLPTPLSLVFSYSSFCQGSPSACFSSLHCCRHHRWGWGTFPLPPLAEQCYCPDAAGWDGGPCSAPGRGVCSRLKGAKSCTPVLCFNHMKQRIEMRTSDT